MSVTFLSAKDFKARFGHMREAVRKPDRDPKVKFPSRADVRDSVWWRKTWTDPLAKWEYTPRFVKIFHSLQYREVMDELRDVTKQQRMVFVREVKKGVTPSKAAKAAGVKLKVLMADDLTQREVDKIIREHTLPAEKRRLLQRALVNKAALQLSQQEEVDYKNLGAFLKLMSEDPEVGIGAKGGVVGISVSATMSPQVEALHRAAMVELQDLKSLPLKMEETGTGVKLLPPALVPGKQEENDVGVL